MSEPSLEALRVVLGVQSEIAFRAEVVFGSLVVLGLILEYAPELCHIPNKWLPTEPRTFLWIKVFALLGASMVTVGVGGELYFTTVSFRLEGNIREIEDKLLAAARKEAAAATERASASNALAKSLEAQIVDARYKTALIERDVAETKERAEKERLARVKIEERLGGWKLHDLAARERLLTRLKPFTGTPFHLFVDPSEVPFMNVLDDVLRNAGWTRQRTTGTVTISGMADILILSGFSVQVANGSLPAFRSALVALVDGLKAEGVPAKIHVVTQGEADLKSIQVIIGRRE